MGADKLLKIPQMPPNLSAQIVCPSPEVWDFDEKKPSLGVRSYSVFKMIQKAKHDIEAIIAL